jgi:uncharacterized integral membrane protein
MRFLKFLLSFLVLLLIFIAAWQNIPPILEKDITFQLDLYWWRWESRPIPIYLIIPLCFLAGVVLMGLIDLGNILRLRHKVRSLEKELRMYGPPAPSPYTPSTPEAEAPAPNQE